MRIAVVIALALVTWGQGPASAADGPRPIQRVVVHGDCGDTPGELVMRESRVAERRTAVVVRGRGLPEHAWYGDLTIQPRSTAFTHTFTARTPRGHFVDRSRWRLPLPKALARLDLRSPTSDGEPSCGLSWSRAPGTVRVDAGAGTLTAVVWEGQLDVGFVTSACTRGSAWTGDVVARWPHRVVRRALGPVRCSDGVVGLWTSFDRTHLPVALAFRPHHGGRDGHVRYRVDR